MLTTCQQAGRHGGHAKTAAKRAAAAINAARARQVRDTNYVQRAAAALVALYHQQLSAGHEPPVAWESAALSVAGERRDIRKAAEAMRDTTTVSAGTAAPRHQASSAGADASIVVMCDEGTVTANPVTKKAKL